jgi:hypothetical protein
MLLKAASIPNTFYRLRSQAILAVLYKTGKRRGELAILKREAVAIEGDTLQITFTLEKKKRHFKLCPNCLTKDKPTKNSATGSFCKKCGVNLTEVKVSANSLSTDSLKTFSVDYLVKHILDYKAFLDNLEKKPTYFFPASKDVFGTVIILQDVGVKGRQIYNIVHSLNSKIWVHLFRDSVAGKIVKADNSLNGMFKVLNRLDLENLETARHYVKRYVGDIIETEATSD